jgi:hypothetical protein
VTWSGLTILAGVAEQEYSVCYCRGNCFTPSNWEKVAGTFKIEEATFTWSANSGEEVKRRVAGGKGALQLDVARPPFGSFSDARGWELKLVQEHFDCDVVMDGAKFECGMAAPNADDTSAPTITTDFATSLYSTDSVIAIKFSEPVTTNACTGNWTLTHTGGSEKFECNKVEQFGTVVLLVPTTVAVGAATLTWEDGCVLDGAGNELLSTADGLEFDILAADSKEFLGAYEVVATNPPHGTSFGGAMLKAYFQTPPPAGYAIDDVALVDCGEDGVCGSDDDFAESDFVANLETDEGGNKYLAINGTSLLTGRTYEVSVPHNKSDAGGDAAFTFEFGSGCPFPSVLTGPDKASWKYDLVIGVAEVGNYQVCFREEEGKAFKPIPSTTGDKYVEILKIDADISHPRGVFHNQYFSGLAGASHIGKFTVAGARLSVPSDAKVILSKGSCSAPGTYGFTGDITGVATDDVVAPQMVAEENYPPGGVTVPAVQVVKIAFNEALNLDACDGSGNITVVNTARGNGTVFTCTDMVITDNFVFLFANLSEAASYHVKVDTGALQDKAGNEVTQIDSSVNSAYTFTIGTTGTQASEVIYSYPTQKGAFGGPDGLKFYFNNLALEASVSGFVQLYDCGADLVCDGNITDSTDVLVYRWPAVNLTVSDGVVEVPVEGVLTDMYRRYRVVLPGGTYTDQAEGVDIEFVNDRTGFEYSYIIPSDATESTGDGLVFNAQLSAGVLPGEYSLCYCDDQSDVTLEDMGDDETTYKLTDDVKQVDSEMVTTQLLENMTIEIAGLDLKEHECYTKCSMGCTGPSCYCDGFTGAAREGATRDFYFCLPAGLCRDACDAFGENCTGINVHDVKPQCLLAMSADLSSAPVAEDWQFFTKHHFSACTQVHDFDQTAGKFMVTKRVDVDVDYVVTPGEEVSIELTTPEALTFAASKFLLSKDRITVIDSLGTCGLSSPSSSVLLPEGATDIATWAKWAPWSYFQDLPHEDTQNSPDPELVVQKAKARTGNTYNTRDGMYCAEHNMDLDVLKVPFDSVFISVKEHQCYNKCAVNAPCTGDNCFCDGYFSGYDDETSNAICGNEAFCQYLCDNLPSCKSIDMHTSANRCFLNSVASNLLEGSECPSQKDILAIPFEDRWTVWEDPTCSTGCKDSKILNEGPHCTKRKGCGFHQDELDPATDGSYSLLIKSEDPNDEQMPAGGAHGHRRLQEENVMSDYSWDKMLRFKPLKIATGGTFKVCFCDSTLLAEGAVCTTEKDFGIQVGTVHASGVSCLLEQPALQRVSCVEQRHGGLRCYQQYTAPAPALASAGISFLDDGSDLSGEALSTFCLSRPMENACVGISGVE